MTQLINLTPHTINIQIDGMEPIAIPSSGNARVSVKSIPAGDIVGIPGVKSLNGEVRGIPVVKSVYGEVEGLPEPQTGVLYIVSMLVGQRAQGGRTDLFGPDSGPSAIRNEKGQIVAVRNLVQF